MPILDRRPVRFPLALVGVGKTIRVRCCDFRVSPCTIRGAVTMGHQSVVRH